MRITIVTGFFLPVPAVSGGATEKIWLLRPWRGSSPRQGHAGDLHLAPAGPAWRPRRPPTAFATSAWRASSHTHRLLGEPPATTSSGSFQRGARPPRLADVIICNTVTLPVWLGRIRPSAGKVAVMIGRAPKGQARFYGGVARIYAPSSFVARRITAKPASQRIVVTGYPIDCFCTPDPHGSRRRH